MSTLCDVCSKVFAEGSAELYGLDLAVHTDKKWGPFHPSVVKDVKWHPLHKSREDYVEGLAYGCELCSFVTSVVPDGSGQLQTSFLFSPSNNDGYGVLQTLWVIDSSVAHRMPFKENAITFTIRSIRGSPHIKVVHDSAVAANRSLHTGSSEALQLASLWLTECGISHDHCSRLSQPIWYPTRLLEITDQTVRLIATAGRHLRGPYVTLSYRWHAVAPKLMLTPETVGILGNGLDIESLEPTFRDALSTARSFGVRYMWIDLFCIFQGQGDDCKQDWMRESVTMDRVYAGSFLNLSAACRHDATAGFFKKRSTLFVGQTSIVSFWARYSGDEPSWYELVGAVPQHPFHDEKLDFYLNSPLFCRGWIVQERILAPRVLHFADRGLVWECCKGVGTQSQPHIWDRFTAFSRSPLPGQLGFSGNSRSDLIYIWCQAFQSYSQSELTMPNQDKLVALQGISKRVATLLHDTLFFGFLSCRMPYQLCWAPGGNVTPRRELENDSFPSWHFARSNEEITFSGIPYQESYRGSRYERPLLCYFHHPELDPEAAVVPKYLCCVAKTVSLVAASCFEQSQRTSLRLVESTKGSDGQVRIASQNKKIDSFGSLLNIVLDHAWESRHDRRTWTLMPVYVSGHPMPGTTPESRLCSGLVLLRTANGDFVRKGVFRCSGSSPVSNIGVLLEAFGKARPEFVMIA